MQRAGRILAVDDNPLNLTVLASVFGEYVLRTANCGREALDLAPHFRPDLVLLDILMPGIDGYETCRRIRSDPSLRRTKVILVSAKSTLQERLDGYEAGADDYVIKPFACDELLAKVRVYLKLKSVEEIEEVKDRMIEVLQHSNRAPLNNIISYAELLSGDYALDRQSRTEAVQVILRHARRLHQLLEKGGTLAGMKSGKHSFTFQRDDLCAVIHAVLREPAICRGERNVVVEASLPPQAEAVFDREQLRFTVRALLENAIRFSRPGGIVSLDLRQFAGEYRLTVTDRGEGISAELLPRVFEAFGNPESSLYNRGDGLSLAIAQQIAFAHDGRLAVASDDASQTTFTLFLPPAGPDLPRVDDGTRNSPGIDGNSPAEFAATRT